MKRAIAMSLGLAMVVAAALLPGRLHAQQEEGLAALNAVRQAAGLNTVRINPLLNRAAADHARYLMRNRIRGHIQQSGRPGFTGREPGDRARHVGYANAGVSENIAQGMDTSSEAVADLMTAIYHRFGFLAVDIDEVGIGWVPENLKETSWVFNMSDAALNGWCTHPPQDALFTPPGTYTTLCGSGGTRLKAGAVEGQQARLPRQNPAVILWPPPGYDRAPPAFYEETPDPLPDRGFSGYPVSTQFNRFKVKAAALRSFRLTEVADSGAEADVAPVRLLSQRTDPNRQFSGLDFAWFPLQRLDWGTRYRVRAEFDVDGQAQRFEWEFRTRSLGMPVVVIPSGPQPVLQLASGVDHALYVAPTVSAPRVTGYRWENPAEMQIQAEAIDPSTLRIRVSGPPCAVGQLTLDGGRRVKLQVAAPPGGNTCEIKPPDFAILATGERLMLNAGQPYRVQIRPSSRGTGIGKIGWKFPTTMQVKVEIEPPDIARIVVEGKACDSAAFEIGGGRTFLAIVAGPGCPATTTGKER